VTESTQSSGWWQASDGRWYPPDPLANAEAQAAQVQRAQATVPGAPGAQAPPANALPPNALPPNGPGPGPGGPTSPSGPVYGYPAFPPTAMYGWAPFAADPSWRRRRVTGAVIMVIGLGLLVWGIGAVYNAVAANAVPAFPHDEQIGLWVNACGILLMSAATIAAGIVQRIL